MKIKLSMKHHCIETEVKKAYNRAVSEYFSRRTEDKKSLETRIALLHHAVQTLNFGDLRNRYAALCAGSDAAVELIGDESNNLLIQINGETIDAKNPI